ncbi:MAG TPA: hypothetical protein VLJ42_05545 [Solirubrobacteraceae bacterium]|nr:hypothetical protein [Solirubrobacteraceae bacterium]
MASPPRRYVLLPEESADVSSQGPRIRRYRLSSVGRRPGLDGINPPAMRVAGEASHLSRMYD